MTGSPGQDGEMLLKKKDSRGGGWGNDRRTIIQRSRVDSVYMSALTRCCCKYNSAVALAWTNFEDARAGRDIP